MFEVEDIYKKLMQTIKKEDIKKLLIEIYSNGYSEGLDEGFENGYDNGFSEGIDEGFENGIEYMDNLN